MTHEVSAPLPQICVAICAHNRRTYLRLALESLVKQPLDRRGDARVLRIYDHNSIYSAVRFIDEVRQNLPVAI
jgi:glycosyltransferase involved in cell wall biosynthesis